MSNHPPGRQGLSFISSELTALKEEFDLSEHRARFSICELGRASPALLSRQVDMLTS